MAFPDIVLIFPLMVNISHQTISLSPEGRSNNQNIRIQNLPCHLGYFYKNFCWLPYPSLRQTHYPIVYINLLWRMGEELSGILVSVFAFENKSFKTRLFVWHFSFGFHLKGREMIKIASHNHPWQSCDMKFSLFLQLAFVEEFFKDSKCILKGNPCSSN